MTSFINTVCTLLLVTILLISNPSYAHTFYWVTMETQLIGTPDKRLKALRFNWQYDEDISALMLEGLDMEKNKQEETLSQLTKAVMADLEKSDYYVFSDKEKLFSKQEQASLSYKENRLTLNFTLPLKKPMVVQDKNTPFWIFDPAFLGDFSYESLKSVTIEKNLPQSCHIILERDVVENEENQTQEEATTKNKSNHKDEMQVLLLNCKKEKY